MPGASLSKLPALLRQAWCALAPWAAPRLMFDGEVPHESGMGAVLP
jgi:hypothetical protein